MRPLRSLLQPNKTDRPGPETAPAPAEDSAEQTPRTKVLVVDDDPIILKTAAMKLESKGYAVVTAKDGAEAIRVARQESPAVILLDISFPPDVASGGGMPWDGFMIMSWLRRVAETKEIPVVVITGGNAAQYHKKALASGARAFFNKPLDHAGLVAVINRIVSDPASPSPAPPALPTKKSDFEI